MFFYYDNLGSIIIIVLLFVSLQSLKKEVDWDRSDDGDGRRSVTGESSMMEYRHPHDPVSQLFENYQ